MDSETDHTAESPHLTALRSQFRTAILSRRKADARGVLGRLVAMSGDEDDRRNLDELIKGVESELKRYTSEMGAIKKRLQDGTTLDAIQQELSSRISHWRAFANDLPDLRHARDGLPAHEDPRLKERLMGLERKLADGEVEDVMEQWEELGAPDAAASGALVQFLNAAASLQDQIEKREWSDAKAVLEDAKNLLETEEGAAFQPGCGNYLKSAEDRLRWEILMMKSSSSRDLRGRERQSLIVELSRAESEIAFQLRETPSLKEIHERIKAEIEEMALFREEAPSSGGSVKVLVIVLLIIVLALIAAWLYLRPKEANETSSVKPSSGPTVDLTKHFFDWPKIQRRIIE